MTIKALTIAALTLAATATSASATSYFSFGETIDRSSVVDLGTVRATSDGVVEIYDFNGNEFGKLLGTQMVNAGANSNVRVNTMVPPLNDVVAVLRIGDEIVAQRDYRLLD